MSGSSHSIEEVLELNRQKLARARSALERMPLSDHAAPPAPEAGVESDVLSPGDEHAAVLARSAKLRTLDCLRMLVSRGAADEEELRFILQAVDTFFPMFEPGWHPPEPTWQFTEEDETIFLGLRKELLGSRLWNHPILAWRCLAHRILEWVGTLTLFGHREGVRRCMELYEVLKERAVGA